MPDPGIRFNGFYDFFRNVKKTSACAKGVSGALACAFPAVRGGIAESWIHAQVHS